MHRVGPLLALAALVAWSAVACTSGSDDKATAETTTRAATTTAPTTVETTAEPQPPAGPATLSKAKRKQIYAELASLRDRGVTGDAVYSTVARREGLTVGSVVLIEHEGSLRRWPLPKPPRLTPAAVRAGRPWGARALRSTTSCSQNAPRTAIAHLRWRPANKPGGRQWIAVTNLLRGFQFGKFEAAGPLRPRVRSFEWRRVHGQSIHFWRVLTRVNGRWLGSPTARFTGPTCVAEFEP